MYIDVGSHGEREMSERARERENRCERSEVNIFVAIPFIE